MQEPKKYKPGNVSRNCVHLTCSRTECSIVKKDLFYERANEKSEAQNSPVGEALLILEPGKAQYASAMLVMTSQNRLSPSTLKSPYEHELWAEYKSRDGSLWVSEKEEP